MPSSWSSVVPAAFGMTCTVQLVPLKRIANVVDVDAPVMRVPVAKQLVAVTQSTPSSCGCPEGGLPLVCTTHEKPFQNSPSVRVVAPCDDPTAQQRAAPTHVTPPSCALDAPPGIGLGICFQMLPFQCTTNGFGVDALPARPTAKQ